MSETMIWNALWELKLLSLRYFPADRFGGTGPSFLRIGELEETLGATYNALDDTFEQFGAEVAHG